MLTRIRFALINLVLTAVARVARRTVADVLVEVVFAGAAVVARARCALVHVRVAPRTKVPAGAGALETVLPINASTAVSAGTAGAFINVHFAVASTEAGSTFAAILVDAVYARGTMTARIR